MAIFSVINNVAQVTNATAATDNFIGGIRFAISQAAVCNSIFTAGTWANGFQLNPSGAVCTVNATAGLPLPNTSLNGLKFDSNGSLCVSTNAMVTYANGLPLDANGALTVNLIP